MDDGQARTFWESHGRVLGEFVEDLGCSEQADASFCLP